MISIAAKNHIETSRALDALKKVYLDEAVAAQGCGLILLLKQDEQHQLKAERISEENPIWAEALWN